VENVSGWLRRPALTPVGLGAVAGALGWAVGTLAFPPGLGTLVLAVGLLAAVGLYRAVRWRVVARPPLPPRARAGLTRLVVLGGTLVVAAALAVSEAGYSKLTVPSGCMIVGACLVPAAGLLDRRGCLVLGGALMLLGACGAVLGLNSAGVFYPTGVVGLGAGVLLWAAVAVQGGLHRELRALLGSRIGSS
jgi:hypothetical protein